MPSIGANPSRAESATAETLPSVTHSAMQRKHRFRAHPRTAAPSARPTGAAASSATNIAWRPGSATERVISSQ